MLPALNVLNKLRKPINERGQQVRKSNIEWNIVIWKNIFDASGGAATLCIVLGLNGL